MRTDLMTQLLKKSKAGQFSYDTKKGERSNLEYPALASFTPSLGENLK